MIPYSKGLTGQDLNVGLIYIVAITGFTTLAILWAAGRRATSTHWSAPCEPPPR